MQSLDRSHRVRHTNTNVPGTSRITGEGHANGHRAPARFDGSLAGQGRAGTVGDRRFDAGALRPSASINLALREVSDDFECARTRGR